MEAPSAAERLARPWLALARRQVRFLEQTAWRRNPGPRWHTANEVILEHPAYRLRDFGGPHPLARQAEALRTPPRQAEALRRPVLIVPPEVNQSYIADFGPDQSLVQAVRDAGFARVAVIEWRSATAETAGRDIDDSLQTILDCIAALGGRVHLIGLCQGGWESAAVAALEPRRVASLTLVAAPIDFHAGVGAVRMYAATLPMAAYRAMVELGGGAMPGAFISAGFDNLLPLERYWLKYLAVWNHLDEPAWMERFHRLDDWYRCRKDLPGPMYLRAVRELFKDNKLIRGELRALGRRVDLARIDCPLALVAGARDHITPPPQVWAAEAATRSPRVRRVLTRGGHVGTFMGREELAAHWPDLLDWIAQGGAA